MKEIMLDIETLGNTSSAVITSIGMVEFDINTKVTGRTFYNKFDIKDQLDRGRKIDISTVEWWLKQDRAVFIESIGGSVPPMNNEELLNQINQFIFSCDKEPYIWANGVNFDITIMESLFATYNKSQVWVYRAPMDFRTFKRFNAHNKHFYKAVNAHNALDDAVAQAKFILEHA